MIATVEAIKVIVRHHELKCLVCLHMDGVEKYDMATGGPEACCDALDRTAALMNGQPFKVQASKDAAFVSGRPGRLDRNFGWICRPEATATPAVVHTGGNAEVLQLIQGLKTRLDEMEAVEDEEDEEEPTPEETARVKVYERLIDMADRYAPALLERFLGVKAPAAAITGLPPGAQATPADGLSDEEFLQAALRARRDPKNAAYVEQFVKMYSDPSKDESAQQ